MTELHINAWFILIVLGFFGLWKLDFFSTLLNLKSFQKKIPAEFTDVIDPDKFEETQEYTRAKSVFSIGSSIFMLVTFFTFWWLGGFGRLDAYVRGFGLGAILSGTIYIGMIFLGLQIISLPFSWYSNFVIEEKFGFNKMTKGTFFVDFLKMLLVAAILGAPLVLGLLYIFANVPMAWLWGWLLTSAYMLFVQFIFPAFIMPLFNRFDSLQDGQLRSEIFAMAEKCKFPVKEISIMNGSKRSSKANAFFAGFGSTKRIVLFDTLVKNHTVPELVAVLAHEIGHFKKRHILKTMVIGILGSGIMFFVLGQLMNNRGLFDAFAVKDFSIYVSLVLFAILTQPINEILSIGGNWMSRKHEFEADAYAGEVTGRPDALASALRKLSVDNMTNLSPHPLYVFLNYSHPPVAERIHQLRD